MLKKLFAIVLALLLACGCALAENPHDLWLGGMLHADLPQQAKLVGNTESEQGYVAQFMYQDAYILHGRFKNDQLRQRYIDMVFPGADITQAVSGDQIAGCDARYLHWITGEAADACAVDAWLFETQADTFLFLVNVDADVYSGSMHVDAQYYPDLIAGWAHSLKIVTP